MSIIGRQLIDMVEEQVCRKGVNAGVYFRSLGLLRGQRLLLDDSNDFRRIIAPPQHTPIAMRIWWSCGENRHCRQLLEMKIPHLCDGLWPDQRRVAGKHQQCVIRFYRIARGLDSVSSSALLFLEHELDAGRGDSGFDSPGLVADDHEDILRGNDL